MNALHTFARLRPDDDELDELTSERIWRSIVPTDARPDELGFDPEPDRTWIDTVGIDERESVAPRRRGVLVAAMVLVVAGIGGVAVSGIRHDDGAAGASVPVTTVPPTTVPPTVAPPTTLPQELPEGGMWIAGQVPTCTRLAADEYDCTLSAPHDPSMPDALNEIGLADAYLDNSSLVAGGCRTTTADSRHWICFVGRRAVDEQLIAPALLGQWQPNSFAAG